MTPRSRSALMTSPDLRRMAAASSPTVTDSGTLISSRLISTGTSGSGRGGAAFGCGFTGADVAAAGAGRGAADGAGARGGTTVGVVLNVVGGPGGVTLRGAGAGGRTSTGGGVTICG